MLYTRRKCFISYHHEDQTSVDNFIKKHHMQNQIFIGKGLGEYLPGDYINSNNHDYIMRRIRNEQIKDSTVTIVFLGKCTWARKYIDWEIKSSLETRISQLPNGLLGIKLPTCKYYPERLNDNLCPPNQKECYARVYDSNISSEHLYQYIEEAFISRTGKNHLINNSRTMFTNNRNC